jgi:Ner family transcriptional regulator
MEAIVDPDWDRSRIKAELKARGYTLRRIGEEVGYGNRDSVQGVFSQPRPPAERKIAEVLGVNPQDIWPSRYEADGTPKGALRYQRIFGLATPKGNVRTGKAA